MKKVPRDIIILNLCTTSGDGGMVPGDIESEKTFLSFWATFCTFAFTSLIKWKINQNFENMKKMPVKISSFYTSTCVPQMTIIRCSVPEIWSATDVISEFFVISVDYFLPFSVLPPTTQKIKKWKNDWRYYHFTHGYYKWKSYDSSNIDEVIRSVFLLFSYHKISQVQKSIKKNTRHNQYIKTLWFFSG